MNSKTTTLLRYLSTLLVSLVIMSVVALAQNNSSSSVTVVATVLPTRIVVVDDNNIVNKVISNTEVDVRPLIVRNTQDGEEVPYTDSIRKQYENIKQTTSFLRPGVVYERQENGFVRFFDNIYKSMRKFLGF